MPHANPSVRCCLDAPLSSIIVSVRLVFSPFSACLLQATPFLVLTSLRIPWAYGSKPATCPVRAVRAWLTAAEITDGPLFRGVDPHKNLRRTRLSDKTVARVVKNAAEAAGYDPALYAGHSLRAGLATAAAQAGVAERVIMAQTGHKSLPMVRKYIREGSLFTQNAAAEVGL